MRWILAFLISSFAANAATYYVSTTNAAASDANPGTSGSPWKTIGHSLTSVSAGDTVYIKPGTYNEFVAPSVSGSAGSLVTFAGERGADGSWLTIIDPSTDESTNTWLAAAEIGSGVYRTTNAFVVKELSITNQRCAFAVSIGNMASDISAAYSTNWTTGAQLLALPSAVQVKIASGWVTGTPTVNFWDGTEALWANGGSGNFTCYLRLRDGSDPNSANIRTSNGTAAINLNAVNYLVFSNLLVRGAYIGISFNNNAHHNTIVSNYVTGGYARMWLISGAYNNTILHNKVTANYYGYTNSGAWEFSTGQPYYTKLNTYLVSKFIMGDTSTWDDGIRLELCGNSNTVSGNHIFNVLGNGIALYGNVASPFFGTEVSSNLLEISSSVGLLSGEGNTTNKVFDNRFSDCNINIRMHHLDEVGETERTSYIYRNTFYLPDAIGQHIFLYKDSTSASSYFPVYWVYNNSLSGGGLAIEDNGNGYLSGGHTNMHWFNNLLSTTYPFGGVPDAFFTTDNMFAAFDYNLRRSSFPTPTANWYGAHNIISTTNMLVNAQTMTFQLPAGSQAIDAGLGMQTTYPTLPEDQTVKSGSAWDIGAIEYQFPTISVGTATFY